MILIPVKFCLEGDLKCVKLLLGSKDYNAKESFCLWGAPRIRHGDGFIPALPFLLTSHEIKGNLRDVFYCKVKLIIASVQLKEKSKCRAVKTPECHTFPTTAFKYFIQHVWKISSICT